MQEVDREFEEEEEEKLGSVVPSAPPSGQSTETESIDEAEDTHTLDIEQEIEEYDQWQLSFEMAFSLHKQLSCFNHILQLVNKFDTLSSPK